MSADPYISRFTQTYSAFGLSQSKLWPANTLCITIAGANTAQTAILKFEACFPDSIVGFIPDGDKADLRFVKYALDLMKSQFRAVTRGATQDNLSLDKLLSFQLPAPPLRVQQRVADVLATYDELIHTNHSRVRILEQMMSATYREWQTQNAAHATLGSILSAPYWRLVSENVAAYEGTKRYFATADVDALTIIGDGVEYSFDQRPSRAQKHPTEWSVWFARMKDTYKVLAFSDVNRQLADSSILSSGFAGLRALERDHLSALFATVNSGEFHAKKNQLCTGATQMSLTNDGLERITVPILPDAAVREFGKLTQPLLDQMLLLMIRTNVLRRTRDLLLPRLLSGQITLTEAAA